MNFLNSSIIPLSTSSKKQSSSDFEQLLRPATDFCFAPQSLFYYETLSILTAWSFIALPALSICVEYALTLATQVIKSLQDSLTKDSSANANIVTRRLLLKTPYLIWLLLKTFKCQSNLISSETRTTRQVNQRSIPISVPDSTT